MISSESAMDTGSQKQEKKEEKEGADDDRGEEEMGHLRGIEDEGDCGFFSCKPRFLQYFNNPNGYLYVFGMFLVTQGLLVNGHTNVIISTLERRFRLQSFQTGMIVVSYDFAYFLLCLFVTFYGNRGHRPRMLAIGASVFGLGCFIFAIPHFTTGLYQYEGNYSDLCDPTHVVSCEEQEDTENLDAYFYLFVFAQLLQGFGCIPLYTLGFTILEDSLPSGKSAIFVGIANSLTIVGPVLGYVVGAFSLSIYVDFDQVPTDELEIDPADPRWAGAWWVGYLLAVGMSWILVAPFAFAFAKQLPGSAVIRSMRESEVHVNAGEEITEQEEFGKSIKDMPVAMCAMFRNSAWVFTTLAGCSEAFIVSAFTAFLPKLIENQFNLSAAEAAFYAGVVAIPGGVLGVLLSAFIVNRLDLKTTGVLKMCIIVCVIVALMVPILLLHCPTPVIAGVNIGYHHNVSFTADDAGLQIDCNRICGCQEEYFSPVCGVDNITYFSACFAGCAERMYPDNSNFRNCSCVMSLEDGEAEATTGQCQEPCSYLAPFLGVFFFVNMFNFMVTTPVLLVIMRCVPETQKTFAVGLQWWIVRPLGSIPGPIVFGVIFDVTCLLWQESTCDEEQGSCYVHDTDDVTLYIVLASIACKCASIVFFSIALYVYKPSSGTQETKLASEDFVIENKFVDIKDMKEADNTKPELSDYENEYESVTAL